MVEILLITDGGCGLCQDMKTLIDATEGVDYVELLYSDPIGRKIFLNNSRTGVFPLSILELEEDKVLEGVPSKEEWDEFLERK